LEPEETQKGRPGLKHLKKKLNIAIAGLRNHSENFVNFRLNAIKHKKNNYYCCEMMNFRADSYCFSALQTKVPVFRFLNKISALF